LKFDVQYREVGGHVMLGVRLEMCCSFKVQPFWVGEDWGEFSAIDT